MNYSKIFKKLAKKYNTENPIMIALFMEVTIIFKDIGDAPGTFHFSTRRKVIEVNKALDTHIQSRVCAQGLCFIFESTHETTYAIKDIEELLL